jgi:hypothetical protein
VLVSATQRNFASPISGWPTIAADNNGICGWASYDKRYCPPLAFLLESKPTFLSKKYARSFFKDKLCQIITGKIACLQATIGFAIFI